MCIRDSYRRLPQDLWPVAELVVMALQSKDAFEIETCYIEAFLTGLLGQAMQDAVILETGFDLPSQGVLSLLVAGIRKRPRGANTAPAPQQALQELWRKLPAIDLGAQPPNEANAETEPQTELQTETEPQTEPHTEPQTETQPETEPLAREEALEPVTATAENEHVEGEPRLETAKQRRRMRRKERLRHTA